jgi:hypothetical protein
MNTRVYKCGKYYYPQHKGWFFWHFMYDWGTFEECAVHFEKLEDAIQYVMDGNWAKYEQVVWESK